MNSRAWTWALLSVAVCYASNVAADNLEWTNPIDGDFDDATKWTVTSGVGAPPPAAGDSIFLNEAGAYTIKLTSNEAADFLRATSGTASLVGDTIATRTLDLTTDTADLSVRGAGTLNLGGIGTPLIVNVGDRFEVGHGSGGGDGTVNLSGAGSELNVLGVASHNIGISGNVGRVNVTDDAALSFVDESTLVLGRSSSGASSGFMDVVDGGDLTAGNIAIATIDSNAFGSLTVRGAGSTAAQTGDSTLSIGNATAATTLLQVIDNAVFTSGTGDITLGQSAVLNVGTVDQNTLNSFGAGGTFNANGPITTSPGSRIVVVDGVLNVNAGLDNSAGGQISLLSGGLLNIANGVFVANDATLDAPEFIVGGEGAGGATELRVSGFGSANVSTLLTIGSTREATVTVTGGGVLNNDPGGLGFNAITRVGQSDTGTLRIEAGSVVNSNDDATIGGTSTGDGTVEVVGVGAVWNVAETLTVGDFGTGTLRIEAGGVVNSATTSGGSVIIGRSGGAGAVEVDGEADGNASTWNHNGAIAVGFGGPGSLEITGGGAVNANSITAASDSGITVRVADPGSQLNVTNLNIGDESAGVLVVENRGLVTSTTSSLGNSLSPFASAEVSVTGGGSSWDAGMLTVGATQNASVGVIDGGLVSAGDTLLGESANAVGVLNVGQGGLVEVTGDLVVGGSGVGVLGLAGDPSPSGTAAIATVSGAVRFGTQAGNAVQLSNGQLEFGAMSIEDFGRITGDGGVLIGALDPISSFTDAASLPASLSGQTFDVSSVQLVNNGVLFGDRSFEVSLTNSAAGEVETVAGERLRFADGTNAGEINNFGGQIRFDGDATNQATGFVGGRGQFIADGGWTNEGAMAFTAGPADLLGDFTNTAGGVVVTSGSAVTTFFDDLEHNGAEIRTAEGSATVVLGEASGAGAYTGTGTVFFEGDLRPGNSPAVVSFEGDVSIGQTAGTLLELAGTELGEFDRLEIAGDLSLDGDLTVEIIEGFAPQLGASFEVISTGGQITGEFASETLIDLGKFLSLDVVYFSDAVLLTVVSNLPGDYNSDGTVNIADYTVWRNNLGSSVTLPGDTTPGEVSTVDYDVWRTNFGASLASSASVLTASVPEPSAVFLLMLSLMSIGLRMNRITPAARPTVVS